MVARPQRSTPLSIRELRHGTLDTQRWSETTLVLNIYTIGMHRAHHMHTLPTGLSPVQNSSTNLTV